MSSMELQQLDQELLRARTMVDAWAAKQRARASDLKDQHATQMRDHAGSIESLKESKQQLSRANQELLERLQAEEQRIASLQSILYSVRSEQETANRHLSALQQTVQVQEVECMKTQSELMVEENKRNKRVGALKKIISMYATQLGLEFRQGPDELLLVMTQIDEKDPAREFRVAVTIQKDNSYRVTRCAPKVPQLPVLLEQLNATYNFSGFVTGIRREFKKLAQQE